MHKKCTLKKHILIAEDHPESLLLLEVILKDIAGCTFETASDGQEAVDKVRKRKFDLIFMDIRMPVLNGYEATRKIRQADPDVPIIALTAHVMPHVKPKCLECGMNDFLPKPYSIDKLTALLELWTKN
ncbi:MAG: response regulator [Candidatus Omnitrophica bacterium]|nr:response regulator [Candidatus Omnitrophota bacterium]